MIFSIVDEKWFVPAIGDNLTKSDNEKLRVKIKIPTAIESEKLSFWEYTPADGTTSMRLKTDTKRILENHIIEIENLSVMKKGKQESILTGKDLVSLRGSKELSNLIDIICGEVLKPDIDETTEKN
jgi:hypothetical protein